MSSVNGSAARNGYHRNGRDRGKQKHRNRLSKSHRELMMYGLLRLPRAFTTAKLELTPEDLRQSSEEYAVLWAVLLDYHEKHGRMPNRKALLVELRTALADETDSEFSDVDGEAIRKLIRGAFDWSVEPERVEEYSDWTIHTVSQFLQESLLQRAREAVGEGDTVPENAGSLFAEFSARIEAVRSLQESTTDDLFPSDWDMTGLEMRRTGLSYFDYFLGGGAVGGEVYGLLGGYGTCKSTLAVQLCVQGARQELERKRTRTYDGKKRLSFLFYWEAGGGDDYRFRALSCAAEVNKTRIETAKSLNDLSRWPKLMDYEQELFATQLALGDKIKGEQERIALWRPLLNDYLVFVDMTGHDKKNPGRGNGGIKEVSRIVESHLRKSPEFEARMVAIDYTGAMIDRQMIEEEAPDTSLRHYIRRSVLQAKNEIGRKFNTPVWMLHQLSGDANAKKPGTVARKTDAAEAKSFAEHVDFCFELGLPTADGLCVLNCDKHRRQKARGVEVLKLRGDLARVESTNGKYGLDAVSKQIVSTEDLSKLQRGHVAVPIGFETDEFDS